MNRTDSQGRVGLGRLLGVTVALALITVAGTAKAQLTAEEIKLAKPSNEYPVVRVTQRADGTLQHYPTGSGVYLAACSIGTAWGGDKNKQCKKNNKKRIAEKFCQHQGSSTWIDAPASASQRKNPSIPALTWQLSAGNTWEQGKWVLSKKSPLIWKKITCARTKPKNSNVWLKNIRFRGLPIQSCYPENLRCSNQMKSAVADAICRGYGLGRSLKVDDDGEPLSDRPLRVGKRAAFLPKTLSWRIANGKGRVVSKVRCKS